MLLTVGDHLGRGLKGALLLHEVDRFLIHAHTAEARLLVLQRVLNGLGGC